MKKGLKVQVLQRGGKKPSNISKKIEKILKDLGMSQRMINTLSIRLEIRQTVAKKKSTLGFVTTSALGSQSNRDFTIRISRDQETIEKVDTFIHELTHIVQLATNKYQRRWWKTDDKLHVRWLGKEMGTKDNIDYWTSPWEVEARNEAKRLTPKYKRIF